MSGVITNIIHPDPYQGYPYHSEEVEKLKEEYDQEKLEELLLEKSREHFRQADGTPFTTEGMIYALPFMADTRMAEEVLEERDVTGPTMVATQILVGE